VKRIVKYYVSALLFSLVSAGVAQAAVIDLNNHRAVPVVAAEVSTAMPSMSELPEPEVLAMMVVGLILIGYKASRHSSEKFK
jgi:hypothetical protein